MSKSILLVDDSPSIRRLVRMTLEASGFRIAGELANGAEAVEKAPRLAPDLIVLDMSMPVMNGLEAAPSLKRMLPNVPIILFTLFTQAVIEAQAKAVGISSVVSKDGPLSKLVGTANALLAA